ncbi:MAG: hypothetical protein PHU81_04275 [Acidobacteriota bacterium]|nr:hypothetical protein [Acidobacteriota bacterium]
MNVIQEEIELQVITPNEPGIFGRVLATLANAGINLRAFFVQSERHQEKGQFHLVTSDYKKAELALRSLGFKIKTVRVITVEVEDRIGVGAEIGALLAGAVIDIRYSYGSSAGAGRTLLVFKTSNNAKALKTLQ